MNRSDKKPQWFELAAARTKTHFTGESELAATTERRVIQAVTRRKRKPKAFWLIPITLIGSGSLAWAEQVELAVQWTVQQVQELVRAEEPETATAPAVVEAKRVAPPHHRRAAIAPASTPIAEVGAETTAESADEPPVAPEPTLDTTALVSPSTENSNAAHASVTRSNGIMRSRDVPPAGASSNAPSTAEPSDLERYRAGYVAQYERHDYAAALTAWDAYLQHVAGGRFTPDVRYHRALTLMALGRNQEAVAALRPFAAGAYGPLRQQAATNLLRELGAQGAR